MVHESNRDDAISSFVVVSVLDEARRKFHRSLRALSENPGTSLILDSRPMPFSPVIVIMFTAAPCTLDS